MEAAEQLHGVTHGRGFDTQQRRSGEEKANDKKGEVVQGVAAGSTLLQTSLRYEKRAANYRPAVVIAAAVVWLTS